MGFFSREKKGDDRVIEGQVQAVSSGFEDEAASANADAHIRRLRDQHKFDPFVEVEKLDAVDVAIEGGDAEKGGRR